MKTGYFALTALNTLATSYYFNYLFFFLRDRFGFGNRENLWVSALHGFIYIFSAWQCGRFAQRRGYHTSLKLGFAGLTLMMIAGGLQDSAAGLLCTVAGYTVVLLFTWPALEALVSENETPAGVQHNVGLYNCSWAAAAALGFFTGGSLYETLGRGAIFWLPAAIFLGQLILTFRLARRARQTAPGVERFPAAPLPPASAAAAPAATAEMAAFRQKLSPQTFLKLAWLANPFAFVAINTLWAIMPALGKKLDLSPAKVGLFCSVWLFGRLAAFMICWRWTGWHYRFRWLAAGFVLLVASFMVMVLSGQLWIVVLAQVFFGLAAGFIYTSSLFYSMDVGEGSAEHGGLHEAAIGAGIFAGPAVGALTLTFLPGVPHAGVLAVSGLLVLGLAGFFALWARARWDRNRASSS